MNTTESVSTEPKSIPSTNPLSSPTNLASAATGAESSSKPTQSLEDLLKGCSFQMNSKELLEYLVDRAGQAAGKRVNIGESVWRSITALFLFGIAFLGFSRINDIEATVRNSVELKVLKDSGEKIDASNARIDRRLAQDKDDLRLEIGTQTKLAVDASLQASVGKVNDEISRQSDLLFLLVQSMSFDSGDAFTIEDAERAISTIEKLAKDPIASKRPELAAALDKILTSFHQANTTSYVDRVYALLPELCVTNKAIVQTLLDHYSRRLLSVADEQESQRVYDAQYKQIAQAAKGAGFGELVFPLDMVILHYLKKDQAKAVITRMLEELATMERERSMLVFSVLDSLGDPSKLSKDPSNTHTMRVVRATREFAAAYAEPIKAIRKKITEGK